ncbi:hypothetical protein [Pelosinus sp. UFO1]|uniref:hypothetical protein n=1 Tax=Pelosinus sp. UFO1 TaxID=484770 RepID=UPI0004D19C77|nr:hypothetical protein [Pelosinus sp. UFO1]AIF52965.1 hypothetical protein UFO1_3422 [Pelosinus sp. UFO1]
MTKFFFPSCKAKATYTHASEKLRIYMRDRYNIDSIGCCRTEYQKLTVQDSAIVVCNNCAAIMEESSQAGNIEFVWDLIDNDADFPFPDYHSEIITIQDCWVAFEKRQLQDTVRSLLKKMNIKYVELDENFEKTKFCGVNLLASCTPSNAKLAPKRYVEEGAHMFTPCPPEEQITYFQKHCTQFQTEKVACYCKFCREAITMGGKQGIHLLELLFPC